MMKIKDIKFNIILFLCPIINIIYTINLVNQLKHKYPNTNPYKLLTVLVLGYIVAVFNILSFFIIYIFDFDRVLLSFSSIILLFVDFLIMIMLIDWINNFRQNIINKAKIKISISIINTLMMIIIPIILEIILYILLVRTYDVSSYVTSFEQTNNLYANLGFIFSILFTLIPTIMMFIFLCEGASYRKSDLNTLSMDGN